MCILFSLHNTVVNDIKSISINLDTNMAPAPRNYTCLDNSTGEQHMSDYYKENELLFYVISAIYLCIALVAIIGNGMVLYVTYDKKSSGRLKKRVINLDRVIKSLATADMLYGLIGMPCRTYANFYVGMSLILKRL